MWTNKTRTRKDTHTNIHTRKRTRTHTHSHTHKRFHLNDSYRTMFTPIKLYLHRVPKVAVIPQVSLKSVYIYDAYSDFFAIAYNYLYCFPHSIARVLIKSDRVLVNTELLTSHYRPTRSKQSKPTLIRNYSDDVVNVTSKSNSSHSHNKTEKYDEANACA